MQVNIETPSTFRRKLTIELEAGEIKRELDRAYNDLKRNVVLKGFRPGRAPQKLLEKFFGDQVRGDVIQKLVADYTKKALEENNLKPMVEPEITTEETDLSKALKFNAVFDVRPEIVVKDYQGLKVQQPRIEVREEEVDQALERLRERQATLKPVEGRTRVERGDFVIAEIEGFAGGEPIPGVKIEERLLPVSDKMLSHGLDEVLAGAEAGQPIRKHKSYGADYAQKELAGKDVEWRAKVKEIFVRQLPNLDDEFAKDLGEHASLAELREKVRSELTEAAKAQAEARVRQGLLELVIERNPIEVPESLVDLELRSMEAQLQAQLEQSGMSHEQAEARVAENRQELRTRAEKQARSSLIVDALADQEQVQVSDEEVAERVARRVTQSGRERERMAKFYRQEENRDALKQSMRREKAVDLLLSRAQVESEPAAPAPSSG
jgi:trigger factor